MRFLLWTGIILLLFGNITRTDIVEDKVDWFELNHCYDNAGMIKFDQVILWEWSAYLEGNVRKKQAVVVTWYMLDKKEHREVLTADEYRVKNAEFRDQWIKDKKKGQAPNYVPKFIFTYKCPRYDVARGKWVILLKFRDNKLRRIYADSYYESWTQFDPEVDNQKIVPSDKRRKLCKH